MLTDAEMTPAWAPPPLNVLPLTTWMPATMLVGLADTKVADWVSLPVALLVTPPVKVETAPTRLPIPAAEIVPLLLILPRKLVNPNATMPVAGIIDPLIVPLVFLHLSYSYASPCGPAMLVTQDPQQ